YDADRNVPGGRELLPRVVGRRRRGRTRAARASRAGRRGGAFGSGRRPRALVAGQHRLVQGGPAGRGRRDLQALAAEGTIPLRARLVRGGFERLLTVGTV